MSRAGMVEEHPRPSDHAPHQSLRVEVPSIRLGARRRVSVNEDRGCDLRHRHHHPALANHALALPARRFLHGSITNHGAS